MTPHEVFVELKAAKNRSKWAAERVDDIESALTELSETIVEYIGDHGTIKFLLDVLGLDPIKLGKGRVPLNLALMAALREWQTKAKSK